jgi:hypothetical protein
MKQGWRDQATASFAEVYNLALAAGQAGQPNSARRTLELGVSLSHKSKTLTRIQVEGFVGLLAKAKLLSADVPGRASALFDRWAGLAPGATLVADISAKLWFNSDQAVRLLRLTDRVGGSLTPGAQKIILDFAIPTLVIAGASPHLREEIKLAYRQFNPRPEGLTDAEVVRDFDQYVNPLDQQLLTPEEVQLWTMFTGHEGPTSAGYGGDLGALKALMDMIDLMGSVYLAQPAGAGPTPGGWDVNRYEAAQYQIAKDSRDWLQLRVDRNSFDKQLHPKLIAFLQILSAFAGTTSSPPFSVTMTNRPPGGSPETVVLA